MPTVYRIRHIPTGMYFCPSRAVKIKLADGNSYQQSGVYVKSNLSNGGKTYIKKPSLNYVGNSYYTHLITSASELNSHSGYYCLKPFLVEEWTIEEVT